MTRGREARPAIGDLSADGPRKKSKLDIHTMHYIVCGTSHKVRNMRIERQLMRGAGPVAVLKLLSHGKKYGYELVTEIDELTDGVLAMGQSTLYPLLYNLEAQGFIEGDWYQAPSGRGRKYYTLTPKGEKRLAAESRQWEAVTGAMRNLGILPA